MNKAQREELLARLVKGTTEYTERWRRYHYIDDYLHWLSDNISPIRENFIHEAAMDALCMPLSKEPSKLWAKTRCYGRMEERHCNTELTGNHNLDCALDADATDEEMRAMRANPFYEYYTRAQGKYSGNKAVLCDINEAAVEAVNKLNELWGDYKVSLSEAVSLEWPGDDAPSEQRRFYKSVKKKLERFKIKCRKQGVEKGVRDEGIEHPHSIKEMRE